MMGARPPARESLDEEFVPSPRIVPDPTDVFIRGAQGTRAVPNAVGTTRSTPGMRASASASSIVR